MADIKSLVMAAQYPYDRFFDALERIFLLPFRHITNPLGITKIQIVGDATDNSPVAFNGHTIITGRHHEVRFHKTSLVKSRAYIENIMAIRGNSRILGTVSKILDSQAPADVELELFGTVRELLSFSGKLIAYPRAVMKTVNVNTINAEGCMFYGDLIAENGGIVRNATFAKGTHAWYGNPDKPLRLINCFYAGSNQPVVPELMLTKEIDDDFEDQPTVQEVKVEEVELIDTPASAPKAPAASVPEQDLKLRRVFVVEEYKPVEGTAAPEASMSDGSDASHEATQPAGEGISEMSDEPIVEDSASDVSVTDSITEEERGHSELIGELDEPAVVSETTSVESETPVAMTQEDDEVVIQAELRFRGVSKGVNVQVASVRIVDDTPKVPLGEFTEEVEPVKEVPEDFIIAHNNILRTLASIRENVMSIVERRDKMLQVYGDKDTKTTNDIKSVAGRAVNELEKAEAFFEASMNADVTLEQLSEILDQLNAVAKTICRLREKSCEIEMIRRRTPTPTYRVDKPASKQVAEPTADTNIQTQAQDLRAQHQKRPTIRRARPEIDQKIR